MEAVVAVSAVVAVVSAGIWFQYRLSRGRMWTPLWMAFGTTAASLLLLVAGTMGHNLSRRERFLTGADVSPGIIWWEVGLGVALAAVSLLFWRQGVRSIQQPGVLGSTARPNGR